MLLTTLDDMNAETQYANTIISMLLMKANPNPKVEEFAICSIRDCIDDALRRYPFQSDTQYNFITWTDEHNFRFLS